MTTGCIGRFTCILNLQDHPAGGFRHGRLRLQQLAIPQNDPQEVIEVMSETTGKLAYCLHFLGLAKALFR
jgi:hypothetical protein